MTALLFHDRDTAFLFKLLNNIPVPQVTMLVTLYSFRHYNSPSHRSSLSGPEHDIQRKKAHTGFIVNLMKCILPHVFSIMKVTARYNTQQWTLTVRKGRFFSVPFQDCWLIQVQISLPYRCSLICILYSIVSCS